MLNPGKLSSLSMVPPVWPRPLPLILATFTPTEETRGASAMLVLSPTPPVECLSAFIPFIADRSSVSPLSLIASVRARVSSSSRP